MKQHLVDAAKLKLESSTYRLGRQLEFDAEAENASATTKRTHCSPRPTASHLSCRKKYRSASCKSPLSLWEEGQGVRAATPDSRNVEAIRAAGPPPNPLPKGKGDQRCRARLTGLACTACLTPVAGGVLPVGRDAKETKAQVPFQVSFRRIVGAAVLGPLGAGIPTASNEAGCSTARVGVST